MRLLNVETLEFNSFFDDAVPPYIILSHTWGRDEVSYQVFSERHLPKHQAFLRQSAGYKKILEFCTYGPELWQQKYMANMPVQWVWIDTCCIDKSSSAELSEAINAMYTYYSDALLCCVYLSDVENAEYELDTSFRSFQASRWFKRGWTLQELVAPIRLEFFDQAWRVLMPTRMDRLTAGDRDFPSDGRYALAYEISSASGIDLRLIEEMGHIAFHKEEIPVATKMA